MTQRPRILTLAALLVAAGAALAAEPGEAGYLAETQAAMNRMMAGMSASPTGDTDRDFVAGMVPHHQGAIDMAQAELRFGHNEQLRRIAQQIVAEQQQEIVALRLALGDTRPGSAASPGGVPGPSPMPMK